MCHLQCTSAQQIRTTQRQLAAPTLHLCTTEIELGTTGTTGFSPFSCAGHAFSVQHHSTTTGAFHSLPFQNGETNA